MAYDFVDPRMAQSPILLRVEGLEELNRLLHEILAVSYRQAVYLSTLVQETKPLPDRYNKEWLRQQHDWLVKAEEHEDAAHPQEG